MASFFVALVFGCLVCADASQSLIRQEPTSMQLKPNGEVETLDNAASDNRAGASTAQLNADGTMRVEQQEAEMMPDNSVQCDTDFTFGLANSSKCSDETHHKMIIDKGLCVQAATSTGARVVMADFVIKGTLKVNGSGTTLQDDAPKGCFSAPCVTGTGTCFFFNPIPDEPKNNLSGTPVCTRPHFVNGTANTNGIGADCPAGYMMVNHTDRCSEVAECLGKGAGEPFEKGVLQNNSKHDELPEGCFIDAVDEKVYFNPELPAFGKPSKPVGTPVCKRSEIVKCTGGGCSTISAFEHSEKAGATSSEETAAAESSESAGD